MDIAAKYRSEMEQYNSCGRAEQQEMTGDVFAGSVELYIVVHSCFVVSIKVCLKKDALSTVFFRLQYISSPGVEC